MNSLSSSKQSKTRKEKNTSSSSTPIDSSSGMPGKPLQLLHLEQKLKGLRKRKNELKREYATLLAMQKESQKGRAIGQQVLQSALQQSSSTPDFEVTLQIRKALMKEGERLKTEELAMAYRLAGKSLFLIPNEKNIVGIRFETFFDGKFYDSYFLLLTFEPVCSKIVVHKHNLPHFIPTLSLADKYLNSDIRFYLDSLDEHLHAYVSRQEQLNQLKMKYSDFTNVTATQAVDNIVFSFSLKNWLLEFSLIYENLDQSLPSRVTATEFSTHIKQRLPKLEAPFLKEYLPQAFDTVTKILSETK